MPSRKILIVLGVVAALIVIGLLALPALIDVDRYRGLIQTKAQEALGREVRLGKLQLSLFPLGVQVDSLAIGALKALREAGKQVPQDVALVGYDDIPIASLIEPGLTTVRQPIERMGSMAAELLLNMLDEPAEEESSAHRIILPAELVIRASCGSTLGR